MFAFGVCIGSDAKYRAHLLDSIHRLEPDAAVLECRDQASIFAAYNRILDDARRLPGLEGLILAHEDVELRAPVTPTLAREFADGSVAIAGAIGGWGVHSMHWPECERAFGRAPDAFYGDNDRGGGSHDVDIVDGLLLALSPWAVQNLRFDADRFSGFHGYDADICMQARSHGRRVRVLELELFHHTKGGFGDVASFRATDAAFRRKWHLPRPQLRRSLRLWQQQLAERGPLRPGGPATTPAPARPKPPPNDVTA